MRRLLITLGGAGLLIASLSTPAAATTYPAGPFNVHLSRVAGPPGSETVVTGQCVVPDNTDDATAVLDAHNGSSSRARTSVQNGSFTLRLAVPPVSADPTDLEISVECRDVTIYVPFTVTTRVTDSAPSLFAAVQPASCDLGYGCQGRVKGLTADGATSNVNVFDGAGSLAAGTIRGVGDVLVSGNAPGRYAEAHLVPVSDPSSGPHFVPFGDFYGGLSVALGDLDGDGSDEVIVAAGPGGGPHVKVYRYNAGGGWFDELYGFFAYDPTMSSGVTVAAADVDADGRDEIITGTGVGAGPHVRVFDDRGVPAGPGFFAYDPQFRGGVNVAAGDVGSGFDAKIVTGTGPGGGPHVRVFRANGTPEGPGFYAYDPAFTGGVAVAVGAVDRFGRDDIVTIPFTGGSPHLRIFTSSTGASDGPGFYAFSTAPARAAVAAFRR